MNRAPVLLVALLAPMTAAACQGKPQGSAPSPSLDRPADSAPSPSLDQPAITVVDAALLDVLPESINGVRVVEAVEEAAIAVADPTVTRVGSSVDVGVAVDASTGNVVTAHIVRLRDGVFDDATFRGWRDSFDEGACVAAGGIEGHAEVPIAKRTVFVTSCVGEQRIYHMWLDDQDLLISASSVGTGDFGEVLMNGLRMP